MAPLDTEMLKFVDVGIVVPDSPASASTCCSPSSPWSSLPSLTGSGDSTGLRQRGLRERAREHREREPTIGSSSTTSGSTATLSVRTATTTSGGLVDPFNLGEAASPDSSPTMVPRPPGARQPSPIAPAPATKWANKSEEDSLVETCHDPGSPHSTSRWRGIKCIEQHEKIFDLYSWDEVLQEDGDGGKVVVCRDRNHFGQDSPEFVLKMKPKESLEATGTESQFRKSQERMLNFPAHPGVVPIVEVLEDSKFYYVLMPKAGCPLLQSLVSEFQDGVMPSSEVKRLMQQILEAISHVHKQGMLHRDIKPDNVVMESSPDSGSPSGHSKRAALIDFDHAEPDWNPQHPPADEDVIFGTLRFNAPETFMGTFSPASDLYSVGVILYLLMSGKMPYNDDIFDQAADLLDELTAEATAVRLPGRAARITRRCSWRDMTFQRLKESQIDWLCNPWPEKPVCKDFCTRLLAFQPQHRFLSADKALAHAWFHTESDR